MQTLRNLGKNLVFKPAWNFGNRKSPENIIITGSPRSGTTWLLEILETIGNTRRIWEPFTASRFATNDYKEINFGLGLRPYCAKDADNYKLKEYFTQLFAGTYHKLPMIGSHNKSWFEILKNCAFPQITIAKFCRAQRLVPWLNKNFSNKIILIMRHPLAVVASSLDHPAFQGEEVANTHPVISDELSKKFPKLCEYTRSLDTLAEKLTATWCFDYKIALQEKNKKLHLIAYENFVASPEIELRSLSEFLQVELPLATYDLVKKPSSTVVQAKKDSTEEQLSKWKNKLSSEVISRVLSVLERFDLDFYSDEIYPNFRLLN